MSAETPPPALPPRPEPIISDPVEALLASGVIDAEWVAAQTGRKVPDDRAAAALAVELEVSPHPLFEVSWLQRRRMIRRSGLHPLAWYFAERRRRNRFAPHPLVDPKVIYEIDQDSREHPYGVLSHWLIGATPETLLPTRVLPQPVTWGAYRAAALDAAREWASSQRRRGPRPAAPAGLAQGTPGGAPQVSVVMVAHDAAAHVRQSIASLRAQTLPDWELVVVDQQSADDTKAIVAGIAAFDPRIRLATSSFATRGEALNHAVAEASTELVAFMDSGRAWHPDHLSRLVGHLTHEDLPLVHAGGGVVARRRRDLLDGFPVDLSTTLVRRDVILAAGGFDPEVGPATDRDLMLRVSRTHELRPVEVQFTRRPRKPALRGPDWTSLVLGRELVDWSAVAAVEAVDDLVSVVVDLNANPRRTLEWLTTTPDEHHEIVLLGRQLTRSHHLFAASVSTVLDHAAYVAVKPDVNVNVAMNIGIALTRGRAVALVRPEALPPRTPLASLARHLDEETALVQPVVTDPRLLVQTAGAAWLRGPHPTALLHDHPIADAERMGRCTLPAPISPVVMVRRDALVALEGLDGRFRSVLAETDLGLRAAAQGQGRTMLDPFSAIASREEYAAPDELLDALQVLASVGHETPQDHTPHLLERVGFDVVDLRNETHSLGHPDPLDDPVLVTVPVLRTMDRINESPPRLRWAIDIAAPSAPRGEKWGDTPFARSLADALIKQGQDVAIDRRDARHRATRDHDDVVLVLRGLDRVATRPGPLHVQWVISHPDMVTPEELARYDLVYAASLRWSREITRDWGIRVEPMLQCTDPTLFNPDRAVPDSGPTTLFVGNSRGVYRLAVRSALALGVDLTLHGRDWAEFLPKELVTSEAVANDELGAMYASASVVLNDHHHDMLRDAFMSNRLFDAAACGARVASDHVDGIEETFHGLVVPFRDEKDLGHLLQPPFDAWPDAQARRDLAARIAAEHSFDSRAQTLVEDAVRALRARA